MALYCISIISLKPISTIAFRVFSDTAPANELKLLPPSPVGGDSALPKNTMTSFEGNCISISLTTFCLFCARFRLSLSSPLTSVRPLPLFLLLLLTFIFTVFTFFSFVIFITLFTIFFITSSRVLASMSISGKTSTKWLCFLIVTIFKITTYSETLSPLCATAS